MVPITLFENFTVYSPRKYFSQNLFFAKWSKVAPSKCWVFVTGPQFSVLYTLWRRRQWHPTPALLPGQSHGWRSLVGYSPWCREESDTTERLHFQFSLSCIGEGNGNPIQGSCLENPRDVEPGGLPSMGLHRVGLAWSNLAAVAAAAFIHYVVCTKLIFKTAF